MGPHRLGDGRRVVNEQRHRRQHGHPVDHRHADDRRHVVELDMQSAQTFNQITINSAGSTNDYARGYDVYVSSDGTTWGDPVATGTGTEALITVTFATQTSRYIRIVQTGTASYWWSIAEINVYSP